MRKARKAAAILSVAALTASSLFGSSVSALAEDGTGAVAVTEASASADVEENKESKTVDEAVNNETVNDELTDEKQDAEDLSGIISDIVIGNEINDDPQPFTITVKESENGVLEVVRLDNSKAEKAFADEELVVKAAPAENWELDSIKVEADTAVELSEKEDGFHFIMPASDVSVSASFSEKEAVKNNTAAQEVKQDEEAEKEPETSWISLPASEIYRMLGVSPVVGRIRLMSSYVVTGYVSGIFDGGATAHLYDANSGMLMYCILPWSAVPANFPTNFADYSISSASDPNLQLMAKLLYYGYGGGGNILGNYDQFNQEAITHFALSCIWIENMGNGHGLSNPFKKFGREFSAIQLPR